jgi:hypothetical protein
MLFETKFLISLLLTLIVEIPILLILVKYFLKDKRNSVIHIIIVGLLASALTLPYLWFVLPPFINVNYYIYIGEILVFLIESLVYYKFLNIRFNKALIISFIANLVSFVLGIIILK